MNLDVAIPAGSDSLKDLDVALLIRVDRDDLLLRDDRPGLWKIRPDDSTNQEESVGPSRQFTKLPLCRAELWRHLCDRLPTGGSAEVPAPTRCVPVVPTEGKASTP